jgi:hypothetical protein
LYRALPDGLKISYGKVAELQARGVVHMYAVVCLDDRAISGPESR